MRSEARIFSSIWRDPDFLVLTPSAQRLYLFLLSQDDLTLCGVIPLREPRWVGKAVGLTAAALADDLAALETARFVLTDRRTGELLVRSLIRRDGIWKQWPLLESARKASFAVESNVVRDAIAEELKRVRAGEDVRGKASDVLDQFLHDIAVQNSLPVQGDFQGDRGVIGECLQSAGERGRGLSLTEGSQQPGLPGLPEPAKPARQRKPREDPGDPLFAEFWSVYPRKVAQPAARTAWARATGGKRHDPALIIRAARAYAADPRRKPDYTAHPATWLNQERYYDTQAERDSGW